MLALGVEGTAHTLGVGVVRRDEAGRCVVLSSESAMLRPEAGGIHPREAANHHAALGPDVLQRALENAGVSPAQLDLVAFSQGPGLGPCLRTAATLARAFALAAGKPLVGVNHCVAHLEIGRALTDARDPVLLYASGGNTQVIAYTQGRYRVFGETLDVGVGNMLDKFAREEGYPFPGGPEVEKLARKGSKLLPMPYSVKGMDMAFSGLLTAARAHRRRIAPRTPTDAAASGEDLARGEALEDVCFSLQETAFAMLVEVAERALAHTEKAEVVLGGGVACNERLWEMARVMCEERGAKAYRPEKRLLVDNGAMIAWQGLLQHAAGFRQTLDEGAVDQRQRTDDIPVTWRDEARAHFLGAHEGRYRGAEAAVEPAQVLDIRALRKRRPAKGYRHPELDATLRETRTRAEARLLGHARKAGVRTPLVYSVEGDSLLLERLPGLQLKEALRRDPSKAQGPLMHLGMAAARLHARGLVHGDLTTSNVLLHEDRVMLIDFGLAHLNAEDEDKGGDLHVLREALQATHPELPEAFGHVLTGYRAAGGSALVERKVEDIARRGRYRGT